MLSTLLTSFFYCFLTFSAAHTLQVNYRYGYVNCAWQVEAEKQLLSPDILTDMQVSSEKSAGIRVAVITALT